MQGVFLITFTVLHDLPTVISSVSAFLLPAFDLISLDLQRLDYKYIGRLSVNKPNQLQGCSGQIRI